MNAKLERASDKLLSGGGSVVYRVFLDGRWIGWVGDQRPWRGHRYGGQSWWASWREEGDLAARWNSLSNTVPFRTRSAAVSGLVTQVVQRAAGSQEGDKDG